jgi:uncharacterized damage-inducible protein DinB
MRKQVMALALGMAMTATTLSAQSPGGGVAPHVAILKTQAETIRSLVLKTAEKVPENLYEFKATPDVRSIAGLLGHIADGNNLLCGLAGGGKPAADRSNEKKTTRADLVAALNASYAACDRVFAATTDANATTPVDFFGQAQTRFGMLAVTNSHMWEHYGNLVTYMRLKNIVPPSSER